MKSGRQILIHLLNEYSKKFQEKEFEETISDRIKAGLLIHGSSSQQMFEFVEKSAWITQNLTVDSKDRGVQRQGLGLKSQKLLLSDLFCLITEDKENIPESVKETYPELDKENYKAGINLIYLLLRLFEWNSYNSKIEEQEDNIEEADKMLNNYLRILKEYQRNPKDFF